MRNNRRLGQDGTRGGVSRAKMIRGVLCLALIGVGLTLGDNIWAQGGSDPDDLVQTFVRGDYSGDGELTIGDPVSVLDYLFTGGSPSVCEDRADANDDGAVSLADAVFLLSYLFVPGASTPSAPYPQCGVDLSVDSLDCDLTFSGACPVFPPLRFDWPMPGSDAEEWVINNYVDLDPGSGILDYRGGAKSYNGHRGIDIDVPNFRAMDGDFPILAAAAGEVIGLDDAHEDRHTSCFGDWNFVKVRHWNGVTSTYGHLKQNSIVVSMGQMVAAGDVLGVVGSSGCSTAPHLHFEVRDASGVVLEPFAEGMWNAPPVYETPLGFLDVSLYRQAVTSVAQVLDPPPNIEVIEPGQTLGVGLSMAGGESGDSISLRLRRPNGSIGSQTTINFTQVYRHSFWFWNPTIPSSGPTGTWRLEIRTNGSLQADIPIFVGDVLSGYQQVRHGVPQANYQALFDTMLANGYRPTWVDGFDFLGDTFFNVIFDKSPTAGWIARHHQTGSQFQASFDQFTGSGYRLVHLDGYLFNGQLRYASIYEGGLGPAFAAYHGVSSATHQQQFSDLVSQGFRAKNISVVHSGTSFYFTALYDTSSVGPWVALSGMDATQYQAEFEAQVSQGRTLAYVNGYSQNGVGRYSAIWNSDIPGSWVARHGLSSAQFQDEFDTWTGAGLTTRFLTGHQTRVVAGSFLVSVIQYSGYWSN